MEEAIIILTSIALILLFGVITSIISSKIRIPNVLFLLLLGIGLNQLEYHGAPIIKLSPTFLTATAVLALVMIIFDSCSRFKFKEFDAFSIKALKMTVLNLALSLTVLSFFMYHIFQIRNVFLVAIFSAMVSGTAAETVLTVFKGEKGRAIKFLEIESIINTPFMVLLPFIIADLMGSMQSEVLLSRLMEQMGPFLQQVVAGIGAGIVTGLVFFKFMRKRYSEELSPVAMITAALLAYILAERLNGNGVLAVTTIGLFFGNIYIKEKWKLHQFSGMLANSLEMLVFVLVGLIISLPADYTFFLKVLVLFIISLLIRLLAVITVLRRQEATIKERIFIALNAPKGIALATISFTLVALKIEGIPMIVDVALVMLLYSIITSTIVTMFSKQFLDER